MRKIAFALLTSGIVISLASCSDNKAATPSQAKPTSVSKEKKAVKEDGPAIGSIETENYVMKAHRAFVYSPEGSGLLAGMKPREGHKFVFLDLSLRNKSNQKLDAGALFVSLKVLDEEGVEYRKPAAALAAYTTEHPNDSNNDEYNALWGTFTPEEFHREIFCAVEVPTAVNKFAISMPLVARMKERKQIEVSF